MKVVKNGFKVVYEITGLRRRLSEQSNVNNLGTITKTFWEI
jgi:hypothetical protein|tara:strand:+ start:561 stop:683 length:123 start_codon:yes stop_codon:yes gene_type:complete